jgi:glycogen operon protein
MKDVTWFRPDGQEMGDEDWGDPDNRTLGMLLLGRAADEIDARGRRAVGDTLFLIVNAANRSRLWTLPRLPEPGRWEELLDTARPGLVSREVRSPTVNVTSHSSLLLRHDGRLSV